PPPLIGGMKATSSPSCRVRSPVAYDRFTAHTAGTRANAGARSISSAFTEATVLPGGTSRSSTSWPRASRAAAKQRTVIRTHRTVAGSTRDTQDRRLPGRGSGLRAHRPWRYAGGARAVARRLFPTCSHARHPPAAWRSASSRRGQGTHRRPRARAPRSRLRARRPHRRAAATSTGRSCLRSPSPRTRPRPPSELRPHVLSIAPSTVFAPAAPEGEAGSPVLAAAVPLALAGVALAAGRIQRRPSLMVLAASFGALAASSCASLLAVDLAEGTARLLARTLGAALAFAHLGW